MTTRGRELDMRLSRVDVVKALLVSPVLVPLSTPADDNIFFQSDDKSFTFHAANGHCRRSPRLVPILNICFTFVRAEATVPLNWR